METLNFVIALLDESLGCPPCAKRAKTKVPQQLKDYWFGRFRKAEHPRTECIEKLREDGSVDSPEAVCQALYSEFLKSKK